MGRNEKCGYEAETGRNTQNTEQIFIRVFLEGKAARTQIPPRPACPRDEILGGFLCGVHRNGTTAHSTGLPIFVLDAPLCVTKFRKDFCAEFTAAGNRRGRIETANAVDCAQQSAGMRKTQTLVPRLRFSYPYFTPPAARPRRARSRRCAAAGTQYVPAFATITSVAVGLPTSDFLRISAVCAARDKSSPICAL